LLASNLAAARAADLIPGTELHRSERAVHQREAGAWRLLPIAPDAHAITAVGEDYRFEALIRASGDPAVLWLPQLEGTDEAPELVLRLAAARGMAALALVPPSRSSGVSEPMGWISVASERVRAARAAVRLFGPEPDGRCLAVVGLSLGGHVAVAVARLEPSVDVLVAMLAGSEPGPVAEVAPLLRPRLPARQSLLVRALWDDVVAPEATDALAVVLGHPPEHAYPSGHESFRSFLPLAVWRALGFVREACQTRSEGS
jgi:hypothetical protein